jgi:hypothetical protein
LHESSSSADSGSCGRWVLAGCTELDAFRRTRIHHFAKREFFVPLWDLRDREPDSSREMEWTTLWRLWPEVLGDMRQVLRRYPLEGGPVALCRVGLLMQMIDAVRVRIEGFAVDAFAVGTDLTRRCAAIAAESEEIERSCAVLVTLKDAEACGWQPLERLHDCHVKIESLPYGVWLPR